MTWRFVLALGSLAATGCTHEEAAPVAPEGMTEAQPGTPASAHRPSFQTDVISAAHGNEAYRRVLFTGVKTQLAVMAIPPGSDVGFEMHASVEQLLFVASGHGKAIVDRMESDVGPGTVLVVTPGTRHDVRNTGTEPLRIYTVYSPPNHIDGRVQPTKSDAQADKADEAFGRTTK
jgi:mannose-6-phosphate isomerase-like protein (cupin superfamily)